MCTEQSSTLVIGESATTMYMYLKSADVRRTNWHRKCWTVENTHTRTYEMTPKFMDNRLHNTLSM